MALTKYTYSIADDTANGVLDTVGSTLCTARMKSLIGASAIETAIEDISSTGDVLDVWMKATLSGGDETILDGVIAAYEGRHTLNEEPHLPDGRSLVTPSAFPKGMIPIFPGVGDDITNNVRHGDTSNRWGVSLDEAGSEAVEWQFNSCAWIGGGWVTCVGALPGDFIDFRLYALATPVAINETTEGNCHLGAAAVFTAWSSETTYSLNDLCSLSGTNYICILGHTDNTPPNATYWAPYCNMIVPAADNGAWDVDLTDTLNENVNFTKACPVPVEDAENPDGYYYYDCDARTIAVHATQKGNINLFDFEIDLIKYMPGFNILGNNTYKIQPDVSAKRLAPQFKYEAKVTHGEGSHQLHVVWNLYVGR